MADIIGSAIIRILPDMSKFGSSVAAASGPLGGLSKSLDGIASKANGVGRSMAGMTLAIGAIGFASFKAAEGFETAMKEVKAVTQDNTKSVEENAAQFALLEEAARDMGRTGLFSAAEMALGLSELSRAGMTADQAITALPKTAELATAAHMKMADTAKVVATQLNVFAFQAAQVGRVVDAIAEADFRSISSMEELSVALAYAGPVADKAGLSFEETTASLGMMANAGFRGSMGGTALRAVFSRLLAPSAKAAGLMKELGINATDVDGKMRPLPEIIDQFAKSNLTAGEAMTIFGQRGGPGFLGFLKQGSGELKRLTELNKLAGDEIGTMSDMMVKKGENSKKFAQDLKKAFLETFDVVSGLGFNIDETSGVLATYIDNGMGVKKASESMTSALALTATDGFAKLIGATRDVDGRLIDSEGEVYSLTAIISMLNSEIKKSPESMKQFGDGAKDLTMLASLNTDELQKLAQANLDAGRTSDVARIQMEGMKGSMKRMKGALESVAITIFGGENGLLNMFADLGNKIAEFLNNISETNPELLQMAAKFLLLVAAISPVAYAVGFLIGGLAKLVALVSFFLTPIGLLAAAIGVIVGAFYVMWTHSEQLRTSVGFLFHVVRDLFEEAFKGSDGVEDLGKKFEGLAEWGEKAGGTLAVMVDHFTEALVPAFRTVVPYVEDFLGALIDLAPVILAVADGVKVGLVFAFKVLTPILVLLVVTVGALIKAFAGIADFLSNHLGAVKVFGTFLSIYLIARISALHSAIMFLVSGSVPAMFGSLTRLGGVIATFGARLAMLGSAGGPLQAVGLGIQKMFSGDLGAKAFKGMVTGAATAAAGVSGYMAGMADDTETRVASMVAAAGSIAVAFAVSGPIGGALAATAAAIGYFFGEAAKKAKKAADLQKEYREAIDGLSESFAAAGIDKFSASYQKAAIILEEFQTIMKKSGVPGDQLSEVLNTVGANADVVSLALADGKDGLADLLTELDRAAGNKANIISLESLDGMKEFGTLNEEVQSAISETALAFKVNSQDIDGITQVYGGSLQTIIADHKALTGVTLTSAEVAEKFQESLKGNIIGMDSMAWVGDLGPDTLVALKNAQDMQKVQKAISDAQEMAAGDAQKFADGYDAINTAVSDATSSYQRWIDLQNGDQRTIAETRLGVIDYANALKDLNANAEMPDVVKLNERFLLTANAQDMMSASIGNLIQGSGGSYAKFVADMTAQSADLSAGITAATGMAKSEADALVASITTIPNEAQFKILGDTGPAITGVDDLTNRINGYINADINNKILLDASDPAQKQVLINKWVENYTKSNPQAKVFLQNNTEAGALAAEGVLAKFDGKRVTATVDIAVNISRRYQNGIDSGALERSIRAREGVVENAKGSVVRKPIISLVGEEGPEVIIPLTDPGRAAQLVEESGLMGVLSQNAKSSSLIPMGMGSPPSITSNVNVDKTVAVAAEGGDGTKEVGGWFKSFAPQAIEALTPFGSDVWAATKPGMQSLTGNILTEFKTLPTPIEDTFKTMSKKVVSTHTDMLTKLKANSAAGGGSIVQALKGQLEAGTGTIATVVGGYGKSLASSLNPVLGAIGAKKIDLSKYAKGGINDPRIVADGAYDVHVFGERGTHGEAYIPFNPALRDRSKAIASETVARLGGVAHFAKGGFGDTRGIVGGWPGAKFMQPGWNWRDQRNPLAAPYLRGKFPNGLIGDMNQSGMLGMNEWNVYRGWKSGRQKKIAGQPGFVQAEDGSWVPNSFYKKPRAFAKGGITGDTKGLNPEFMNRLAMWAGAVGSGYYVKSGYRSVAEQVDLYNKYLAGRGHLAAPPGRSMHNFGLAADGPHWKNRNPGAFGLAFTVPSEAWHVEPVGARGMAGMMPDTGWPGAAALKPLPKPPSAGSKGALSAVAGQLMGSAYDQALDWAAKSSGAATGASPSLSNLPVSIRRILATIRAMESGGNYTARNPYSSAAGAYQFTKGTWNNFGGYASAADAPASTQDSRAAQDVQRFLSSYGGKLDAVPGNWYNPAIYASGNLDRRPGGPGNPLSVQAYINKWLAKYGSIPGYKDGAMFTQPTFGMMGEDGSEVLLPLSRPGRALKLAVESGLMSVLDNERVKNGAPQPTQARTPDSNSGFLDGSSGNVYHISGITLDQVRAEIRAHDEAVNRVRR